MARRAKSLKYGVLQNDGQGYGHRDHTSKKGRVRGYRQKRENKRMRQEKLDRLEKREQRQRRSDDPLGLFDNIL